MSRTRDQLGMEPQQADLYARLAYSVYLGAINLRRADPADNPTPEDIERRVQLFVHSVVPADLPSPHGIVRCGAGPVD